VSRITVEFHNRYRNALEKVRVRSIQELPFFVVLRTHLAVIMSQDEQLVYFNDGTHISELDGLWELMVAGSFGICKSIPYHHVYCKS
jgi:hypothetical protein